jgi:hypothetical protein
LGVLLDRFGMSVFTKATLSARKTQ